MNNTVVEVYELETMYDSRKSFYGKAKVLVDEETGVISLQSYDTIVARISDDKEYVEVYGTYSNTTLRHIKEFLLQHGFEADTKKQIEEDYIK